LCELTDTKTEAETKSLELKLAENLKNSLK